MNRQVPDINNPQNHEVVAVVGNGRVAQHMIHYFELVGQPYVHWFRNNKSPNQTESRSRLARFKHKLSQQFQTKHSELREVIQNIDKVLILIPDDQIERFIDSNPILSHKTCIHFSGSLHSNLAVGCHPLMTFGSELYELKAYQSIPFVIDEGVNFSELLPLFRNPVYKIKAEHKAIYHAYCVMAGNFSQMLWQSINTQLPGIGLPSEIMSQYLMQNTANFVANPQNAATGPLVRGDYQTIQKHLLALDKHPLAVIYETFLESHHAVDQQEKMKKL